MKNYSYIILITSCLILLGIYIFFTPAEQQKDTPSVINVGILPDENLNKLYQRYDPLLKYLSKEIGIEFKLIVPSSYDELLQMFRNHKVDLAYFGGFTFLKANLLYHAEPLVMREVDTRFTSWFIVKKDNKAQNLSEFKNKSFAFGSQLSTSGHLMPRYFMQLEKKIIPEDFFTKVHYSNTHDNTVYLVRDGVVDLGVANSEIIKRMLNDGRLQKNDIRILWETPPYPDYVWAIHNHFNDKLKISLRNAFMTLDFQNADQRKILSKMGTESFLPTETNDFISLNKIAKSLGLLEK